MSGVRPVTFQFERENPSAIAGLQKIVTNGDSLESAFYFSKPYRDVHGTIPGHVYRAEFERAIALKHGGVALRMIGLSAWCKNANKLGYEMSKGLAPRTYVEFETSDLSGRIPSENWPLHGWK